MSASPVPVFYCLNTDPDLRLSWVHLLLIESAFADYAPASETDTGVNKKSITADRAETREKEYTYHAEMR